MIPESGWTEVLEGASRGPVTLVIGASDTGKTSLVTFLANGLLERGFRVGIVDADLGQSEIGPPTTIGLGTLRRRVEHLGETEVLGLHFVGATSPQGHLLPTVIGTRRMVDKALRLGLERVVVDTSGLVAGELGRRLKQQKIDLVDPDLLVCLAGATECAHILRAYDHARRPTVMRLAPGPTVGRRSAEERRRRRAEKLARYFRDARRLRLDLSKITLREPPLFLGPPVPVRELAGLGEALGERLVWGERREDGLTVVSAGPTPGRGGPGAGGRSAGGSVTLHCLDDFEDALAGLDDAGRETLGLGRIVAVDFPGHAMTIDTPVPAGAIASVQVGREKAPPGELGEVIP